MATGDFNGDGLTDLVFGRSASAPAELPTNPVFENTGGGVFVESAALGASPTADVLTEDVNLDGIVDIVAINATGAHQIYVGDGVGGFSLHPQQFAASGIVRGTFGDINGDGRNDLSASEPTAVSCSSTTAWATWGPAT